MTTLKFPDDFARNKHRVIPGAFQYLYEYNDTDDYISIVGGGFGLHGDGFTTFEMWDTKNMEDPQGYMTADEINQWLLDNPIKEQ